jgi:hypothetical protein
MEAYSSLPALFLPLPPDKGDYHYTLYSRIVKGKSMQNLAF